MTAVVGPVDVVRFRDGSVASYAVPSNTLDPRWEKCTDHRQACDCREAELSEQIAELRAELGAVRKAARHVLAGHPTYAWEDAPDGGHRDVGCACTGCQIVREASVLPATENSPSDRDEVYGLAPMQDECGYRWKVCHDGVRRQFSDVCRWAVTRDRGHFHEHLTDGSDRPVKVDTGDVPF